jgi:hypothetical protein
MQGEASCCVCIGAVCAAQGRNWVRCTALGDHVARTPLTPPALGGHTQLELDIVEAHACTHMAGDFPVRNSVTHTNNHGYRLKRGGADAVERSMNKL